MICQGLIVRSQYILEQFTSPTRILFPRHTFTRHIRLPVERIFMNTFKDIFILQPFSLMTAQTDMIVYVEAWL
jgi:hypothetical protein